MWNVNEDTARVFEVRPNVNDFQALLVDAPDAAVQTYLAPLRTPRPVASWSAPPVYVDQPMLQRPDIYYLVGTQGVLVMTPAASDVLTRFLVRAGEVLPLPFQGETLSLLHVTTVIDCLDTRRSDMDAAGIVRSFAFVPHRLSEAPLFRVPQNNSTSLFAVAGKGALGWDFRRAVEQAELTGLVFDEVWNADLGPIRQAPRW